MDTNTYISIQIPTKKYIKILPKKMNYYSDPKALFENFWKKVKELRKNTIK